MYSKEHKISKQHSFDSYCKKILRNEARNYYDELKHVRKKETSIDYLSQNDLEHLSILPKYFEELSIFKVDDLEIVVNDEDIAYALKMLPEDKRSIILLSYFLEMTDQEIANQMNLVRQTVQYRRSITLKLLKKMMEENND